jgi:hypothetical protein
MKVIGEIKIKICGRGKGEAKSGFAGVLQCGISTVHEL